MADLEEDVEDPGDFEDWDQEAEQSNGGSSPEAEQVREDRHVTPRASLVPVRSDGTDESAAAIAELQHAMTNVSIGNSLNGIANQPLPQTPDRHLTPPSSSSVTQPVTININGSHEFSGLSPLYPSHHEGLAADGAHNGPMTPRNDAGPFVLDGSAGRASGSRLRDPSPHSDSASARSVSASGAPTLPPVRFD